MRVIAGSLKGRQLKPPTWAGLRPTSDKLRETLFNVLSPRVAGARVLDGYAGSGALGIEALSRGAAHVTFVERDRRAQALIAGNLALCGVESGCAIIRATVARSAELLRTNPAFVPFDLILLDPPYGQPLSNGSPTGSSKGLSRGLSKGVTQGASPAGSGALGDVLVKVEPLLAPGGLVVIEHARRQPSPETAGGLSRDRLLVSGDSSLSFYSCQL